MSDVGHLYDGLSVACWAIRPRILKLDLNPLVMVSTDFLLLVVPSLVLLKVFASLVWDAVVDIVMIARSCPCLALVRFGSVQARSELSGTAS